MARPLAILIGAGPGLGMALVRRFAAGGMNVAFAARRAAAVEAYRATLAAEGHETVGGVADAASPDSLDAFLATLPGGGRGAEVLIYNAALIEPSRFVTPSGIGEARYGAAPGWKARGAPVDAEYLIDSLRTNVGGALHAARHVAPGMMAKGGGTILLTGGVLAFEPWIEWGATALGKAALRSLGHSLYKELRPHGVQVATIAIHGTMAKGTAYDHDRVADAYWQVHRRPAEAWQPDVHFRADATDGGDPDA